MLAHHFLHYYSRRCRRMVLELASVISPSVFKGEALTWAPFWRALKFQAFNWRVGSNSIPRRRYEYVEMNNIKLVVNLCMDSMVRVSKYYVKSWESTIWLHFFVLAMPYTCWFLWRADYIEDFKGRLHCQFGFAFWSVVLREVYILKGQIAIKWHCRLRSWTLGHAHTP